MCHLAFYLRWNWRLHHTFSLNLQYGRRTNDVDWIHLYSSLKNCVGAWNLSKIMYIHSMMHHNQCCLVPLSDLSSTHLITCLASVTFKVLTVQRRARSSNLWAFFGFDPENTASHWIELAFRVTIWVHVFMAPLPKSEMFGKLKLCLPFTGLGSNFYFSNIESF